MQHLWSSPRRKVILAGLVLTLIAVFFAWALPDVTVATYTEIRQTQQTSESVLLDRNNNLLHVSRSDFTGRWLSWVELKDISPVLLKMVITAEDQRFYQHGGVDFQALASAATSVFRFERPRGASTITMQLSGLLSPEIAPGSGGRSLFQKWKQMRTAWAIERTWSKSEILESYLNLITYRSELKGLSAASEALFGKAPSGIDQIEAATIAALIRAPNATTHRVEQRACTLLSGHCKGLKQFLDTALRPPFQVRSSEKNAYHVFHRLHDRTKKAETISSTLDSDLQHFVIDTIKAHVLGLEGQNLQDAAVIIADNKSGEVLAYVGSSGTLSKAQYVDGVRARRQAGSTLKPFIYALALEKKYLTAATLLEDGPIEIPISTGGVYRPRNYDSVFYGPITLREALGSSLNTPAVRAILTVGTTDTVQRLTKLGFENLMAPEFYGASLALGSADVTLWELTNAYRTLANGGKFSSLHLTTNPQNEPKQVMSEAGAYIITSILSDRFARVLGFGLESALSTPYFSAVKTGTSKDMRDNWCIGYSSKYTVGVWAGNFSGKPMWNVSGVSGAAPIWRAIMDHLHRSLPSVIAPIPMGVSSQNVTISTTGKTYNELFIDTTEHTHAHALSHSRPQIIYPTADTILAIDPDIPDDAQKIHFQASGLKTGSYSWKLNTKHLGPAQPSLYWSPTPGRYQLSLLEKNGQTVDKIHFEVR